MKNISMGLVSIMMLSGCAMNSSVDPMEQEATAMRARQFLAETSPRNMNGHPKVEDNVVDRPLNCPTQVSLARSEAEGSNRERSASCPDCPQKQSAPASNDPGSPKNNEYINETE
jgi:hypothetical protein